jgi:membrane dipeptidase
MIRTALFLAICLLGIACTVSPSRMARKEQRKNLAHARTLLATTPIVDTHIDFPWHLVERNKWFKPGYTNWAMKNPDGDFDYERAKKGGLYGAFMSIYIPSRFQDEKGRCRKVADSLIDVVHAVAKALPDHFALAMRAADVEQNFKKGIISLPMGMENGAPIERIEDVAYFHQRGIRYVTLTHGRDNQISDSSYDTLNTHGGLSEFGRSVVREMNRVGIMVDVSHLSDAAIEDVVATARKPLVASHSACRFFTPGFQRNLSDTLVKRVAATGGVVQVPFSMYFLDGNSREAWKKAEGEMAKKKVAEFGPQPKAFMKDYAKNTGAPIFLSVKEVANHIDRIVQIAGIDYVGLGSDFDGVGIALPPDLADVSMYPNLMAELIRRGYSDEDIQKICYKNLLRVWKANEH